MRAHTANAAAILDIGRWPSGTTPPAEAVAAAFRLRVRVDRPADIARWKYAKLLLNLGNPVDALCGRRRRRRSCGAGPATRARRCSPPPASTT